MCVFFPRIQISATPTELMVCSDFQNADKFQSTEHFRTDKNGKVRGTPNHCKNQRFRSDFFGDCENHQILGVT